MNAGPILVTGAGGDIGNAIVRALRGQGRDVVATAPSGERARLADADVRFIAADLPGGIGALVSALPQRLAGIVHAAGAIATHDALAFDRSDYARVMAINVETPIALTAALADRIGAGGAIVFVGSVAGTRASPTNLLYGASKAAAHSAAKSFAKALAPRGVRVNTVCPGLIDTRLTQEMNADLARLTNGSVAAVAAGRARAIPIGRAGTVDEIAAVTLFLLSDDAAFMTGAEVMATGGGDL